MARTKYTDRFCKYCNKETRMEMVGAMEGVEGKIWCKCTRCHQTQMLDAVPQNQTSWKMDPSSATLYSPLQSFQIGEAIYHQEWNDIGKVTSKMKTSDGSQAIVVSFEKLGQRRLIENLKPETPVESDVLT